MKQVVGAMLFSVVALIGCTEEKTANKESMHYIAAEEKEFKN